MNDYVVKCVGNRELHVSRQEDGKYSIKIIIGYSGQKVANLILEPEEAKKLKGALIVLEGAWP